MKRFSRLFGVVAAVALVSVGVVAYANHSWGSYHWARTANPFTLKLGDNVSTVWDMHLATTSVDWSVSSVLDTTLVVLGGTNATRGKHTPKNCVPTSGRVEVCSAKYGSNGWLGLAQIWVSGSHITQGVAKMNDTYFNTAPYNTSAWRQFVMCQEVGHTFGLDHQDETFTNANLGTCMDYTNDPDGGPGGAVSDDPSNEHPNQHDYDQLEAIYAHLDSFTTVGQTLFRNRSAKGGVDVDIDLDNPAQWGKELKKSSDGRSSLHEKDLGNGNKVFTFVIWAD